MPKVPYPYEVNGKVVTGNGSLIPICSLLPSLTVFAHFLVNFLAPKLIQHVIAIGSIKNLDTGLYLHIFCKFSKGRLLYHRSA